MAENEKPVASVIAETKEELKTFIRTRILLLQEETRQKLKAWKYSSALLVTGLLFLVTAWVALVFAVIAVFHSFLGSGDYSWCFGGLIVFGFLFIFGSGLTMTGIQGIKAAGIAPKRTLEILKRDQKWIHKESRTA